MIAVTNLSIRGLDDQATQRLKEEAANQGVSINAFVIGCIRKAVGLSEEAGKDVHYHDLDKLAGTWSEADVADFHEAIAAFERIDENAWQ